MKAKTDELRERLDFARFDAYIVDDETQRLYLTGFSSTDGTLFITRDGAFLCVDSRYIEAALQNASGCEVKLINGVKDFYKKLCVENGVKKAAVSGATTIDRFERLKELTEVSLAGDKALDRAVEGLRSIKTEDELSKIRRAQHITDGAFEHMLGLIKPGKTERELQLELEFYMRKNGSDGMAFDVILISGNRTSMPHGVPSDKEIENGDFVTMDFGAKFAGYCSDMTRTVAVGRPDDEMKRVYGTVLDAQGHCLENIRAGIKGYEADRLAREVIDAAGYGEYFGHSTGHSLGLCVHESPSASPLCRDTLLPFQLMTVEPGIYLPGKFGVRIEDLVILREDGCENITKSPKELIVL